MSGSLKPGDWRDKLANSPLLVALGEDQLDRLLGAGSIETHGDGEAIIREGEAGESLYLILHGEVAITSDDDRSLATLSSDETLRSQYEGDFFGEMSILDHESRSATVTARGEVTLFRVRREDLFSVFGEDTDLQVVFLTNLCRGLSRRLRRANLRYKKG